MYKRSSTPSNNTALWHYLSTKHLDFRHENDSTPGVLIKEMWYVHGHVCAYVYIYVCVHLCVYVHLCIFVCVCLYVYVHV